MAAGTVTFPPVRHPAGARAPLYCLPFLGGSADFYRPLSRALPGTVVVRPVELAGHGSRWREPAPRRLPELVEQVAEAIAQDAAGRPYALFGHCSGGLLAYETARRLDGDDAGPLLLAASATYPPPLFPELMARLTDQPLHRLAPLLTELAGRSATYRAGATALYKRQYGMYLTYQYHDEPLLDCPVSTFTGRDDPIGPAGVQHEWDPLTTSWSRHRVYPGRHFYLTDHWPDVAGNLAHDLGGAVG